MKKLIIEIARFLQIAVFNAQKPVLYKDADQKQWVDSTYVQMSLEEKVGQLFIVAAYSNKNTAHENEILNLVKNQHIGGLIFMQDNVEKQIQLTNLYQQNSKIPLLLGMDAEWDLSMRLKNTHKFPYSMTLGAIQNDSLVFNMGEKVAEHCKLLGVNWNFAPVVDVNTNPNNPIIGNRSYGSDVDNVSRKGTAYANGMQSKFVLASAKHFPGHGDTSSDSHKTLPTVAHTKARLDTIELKPFQNLIDNGVTGIMVAHLDVPNLEPNNLPSSLSHAIITDKLKNEMGFEGLIITDALNMQGVASKYAPGIVDVMAFEAGNDVLLFSQNVVKAKAEIIKKINAGKISQERLEESVKKILKAKYFAGITSFSQVSNEQISSKLNDEASKDLNEKLFSSALTLVKNETKLPFKEGEKISFLSMGESSSEFQSQMKKYTSNMTTISASSNPSNQKIVIGVFKDTSSPYKSYKLSSYESSTIEKLAQNNEVTVVLFTSPYSLKTLNISNIKNVMVAYENNSYTQNSVPKALFGYQDINGKLPVDVNSSITYGMGVTVKAIQGMAYATPESQGLNSTKLQKIDAIAERSIARNETPGMQILVAKNGKIVYEKNFGYTDYSETKEVTGDLIYDLASVTKILATLPFVMKLYEEGEISLNDEIQTFFPYVKNTDKAHIQIKELLLHNSGLTSWIPYYKETLNTDGSLKKKYYNEVLNAEYQDKVADNIYARFITKEYIYDTISKSTLEPKTYDYSDLGFYMLQYLVEHNFKKPLNELLDSEIAQNINANTLTFNPLEKFEKDQMVPTEYDTYYRNQLIQGYVHDQGAAMMGGVAGHAGLFGNAKDVAKMMQLYCNGGSFNGFQFLKPETLEKFTAYQNSSRRGLGFDKQRGNKGSFFDNAPSSGFGHTGFTGTMVWADPKENLVYVFLSNRTYPDSNKPNKLAKNNTRSDILKVVYEAINIM